VLLDSLGREVARVLTPADGRFVLRVPGPGRYRLRSERLGYEVSESRPIVFTAADQSITLDLAVNPLGLNLDAVEITAQTTCPGRAVLEPATVAVWDEVLKAVTATAWTSRRANYRFRTVVVRRVMTTGGDIFRATADTATGLWAAPFATTAPAALASRGYVVSERDSTTYFGPDAAVLQDSSFVATHCFGVVRDSGLAGQRVGLSFEPVPERELPDVKGVLWLEEGSGELRALEYTYTHLPARAAQGKASGSMDFLRLPSGAWIVRRWAIRMPQLAVVPSRSMRTAPMYRIAAMWHHTGEVLEVRTPEGERVYPP
jgi:hypothetical protein